jgi:hypothetical protein
MESEKFIYWTTLGVLALATTTGFVTEHRGWGDLVAERSIALVSQASEVASNYVEDHAGMISLVCAQRTMVRHQAEMARLQAMSFRVRTLKLVPRTIVLPDRNLVIQVPQNF